MRVHAETVKKIAELARLQVADDEVETYRGHLEKVLDYVEKLNELETDQIEPTYYVQHTGDFMREDVVKPSLPMDAVMENAPAHARGFFRVPKVIGDPGGQT